MWHLAIPDLIYNQSMNHLCSISSSEPAFFVIWTEQIVPLPGLSPIISVPGTVVPSNICEFFNHLMKVLLKSHLCRLFLTIPSVMFFPHPLKLLFFTLLLFIFLTIITTDFMSGIDLHTYLVFVFSLTKFKNLWELSDLLIPLSPALVFMPGIE